MGVTPEDLGKAVASGSLGTVSLLISRGIDVNAALRCPWEGDSECTALHLAAHRGDAEMCSLLVALGASTFSKTPSGATPADVASSDAAFAAVSQSGDYAPERSQAPRTSRPAPPAREDDRLSAGDKKKSTGRRRVPSRTEQAPAEPEKVPDVPRQHPLVPSLNLKEVTDMARSNAAAQRSSAHDLNQSARSSTSTPSSTRSPRTEPHTEPRDEDDPQRQDRRQRQHEQQGSRNGSRGSKPKASPRDDFWHGGALPAGALALLDGREPHAPVRGFSKVHAHAKRSPEKGSTRLSLPQPSIAQRPETSRGAARADAARDVLHGQLPPRPQTARGDFFNGTFNAGGGNGGGRRSRAASLSPRSHRRRGDPARAPGDGDGGGADYNGLLGGDADLGSKWDLTWDIASPKDRVLRDLVETHPYFRPLMREFRDRARTWEQLRAEEEASIAHARSEIDKEAAHARAMAAEREERAAEAEARARAAERSLEARRAEIAEIEERFALREADEERLERARSEAARAAEKHLADLEAASAAAAAHASEREEAARAAEARLAEALASAESEERRRTDAAAEAHRLEDQIASARAIADRLNEQVRSLDTAVTSAEEARRRAEAGASKNVAEAFAAEQKLARAAAAAADAERREGEARAALDELEAEAVAAQDRLIAVEEQAAAIEARSADIETTALARAAEATSTAEAAKSRAARANRLAENRASVAARPAAKGRAAEPGTRESSAAGGVGGVGGGVGGVGGGIGDLGAGGAGGRGRGRGGASETPVRRTKQTMVKRASTTSPLRGSLITDRSTPKVVTPSIERSPFGRAPPASPGRKGPSATPSRARAAACRDQCVGSTPEEIDALVGDAEAGLSLAPRTKSVRGSPGPGPWGSATARGPRQRSPSPLPPHRTPPRSSMRRGSAGSAHATTPRGQAAVPAIKDHRVERGQRATPGGYDGGAAPAASEAAAGTPSPSGPGRGTSPADAERDAGLSPTARRRSGSAPSAPSAGSSSPHPNSIDASAVRALLDEHAGAIPAQLSALLESALPAIVQTLTRRREAQLASILADERRGLAAMAEKDARAAIARSHADEMRASVLAAENALRAQLAAQHAAEIEAAVKQVDIEARNETAATLRAEHERATKAAVEAAVSHARAEAEAQAAREALGVAKRSHAEADATARAAVAAQASEHDAETGLLRGRISDLEEAAAALEARCADLAAELSNARRARKEQIAALEAERAGQVSALEEQLAEQVAAAALAADRTSTEHARMLDETVRRAVAAEREALERESRAAMEEVRAASAAEVSAAEAHIDHLTEEVGALTARADKLASALSRAEADLATAIQRAEEGGGRIVELERTLRESEQRSRDAVREAAHTAHRDARDEVRRAEAEIEHRISRGIEAAVREAGDDASARHAAEMERMEEALAKAHASHVLRLRESHTAELDRVAQLSAGQARDEAKSTSTAATEEAAQRHRSEVSRLEDEIKVLKDTVTTLASVEHDGGRDGGGDRGTCADAPAAGDAAEVATALREAEGTIDTLRGELGELRARVEDEPSEIRRLEELLLERESAAEERYRAREQELLNEVASARLAPSSIAVSEASTPRRDDAGAAVTFAPSATSSSASFSVGAGSATSQARTDADAGVGADADAGAGVDAGVGAGADAGVDAGVGSDAGADADVGSDAGADAEIHARAQEKIGRLQELLRHELPFIDDAHPLLFSTSASASILATAENEEPGATAGRDAVVNVASPGSPATDGNQYPVDPKTPGIHALAFDPSIVPPGKLTIAVSTRDIYMVSWEHQPPAPRYALAFRKASTGEWYKLPVTKNVHGFAHRWLGSGEYVFRAKAITDSGTSAWSEDCRVKIP